MNWDDLDTIGQGSAVLRSLEDRRPPRGGPAKKRDKHKVQKRYAASYEVQRKVLRPKAPIRKYPHRKKNQKRPTDVIRNDTVYQNKLEARRGKYGKRVRKLKWGATGGRASGSKNRVPSYTRKGGVHIRHHFQHPRGYRRKKSASIDRKYNQKKKIKSI